MSVDLHRVPGHVAIVGGAIVGGAIVGGGIDDASLADVVDGALAIGLRWLTVEVVPSECWAHPVAVTRDVCARAEALLLEQRDELHRRGVRVRALGRRESRLPARLQRALDDAEALTADNHGMTLTVAVDHDGRVELAEAMAGLATEVREGRLRAASIDEDLLAAHLARPDLPDPDLVVRIGDDTRTANFLVWQSAYSEFVFTDVRWPDFGRDDLFAAVAEYQRRERRFGAVEPT